MECCPNLVDAGVDPGSWARAREAEGWPAISASDHLWDATRPYPHWAVTLTQLAVATSTCRVASSFANNLLRSPVEFAQAALSLQRASGGRFEAGLGAGWLEAEIVGIGARYPSPGERAGRYAEAMRVVRELFDTGRCTFEGEQVRVDVPTIGPAVDVPPPLVASVGGPRTIREVVPVADRVELKVSSGATRGGRLDIPALGAVAVDHLRRLVDLVREVRADIPLGVFLMVGVGDHPRLTRLREALGDGLMGSLIGEPAEVAERVVALADHGIERVQLTPYTPDTIERLAPHLAGGRAPMPAASPPTYRTISFPSVFGGIASWVAGWARLRPDDAAVIFDGRTITWAEYDEQIDRWAHGLRGLGVRRGDRVGLYMRNRPEFLYVFFATARLGAIVVPVNHFLSGREVTYTLAHSGATVVVTDGEFDDVIDEVAPNVPVERWVRTVPELDAPERPAPIVEPIGLDDPAVILYTSGTTGHPKGAVTTHGGILFCTLQWVIQVRHAPGDVHICHFPLAFTGGTMSATMPVVHSGGTMILDHGFDPGRTLEYIERYRITFVAGVPTMWKAMLDHPRFADADLSSLRLGFIGAAPVPLPLIEAYRARGVPFAQAYALTEGNGLCLFLPAEDIARKVGSCGLDLLYCEARVVDDAGAECAPGEVGELVLRGPVVFAGYWDDPDETERTLVDGWLRTGDLASRDAEGYVTIVDRKKDLIITGGLNVYPAEVESVLYGIDGVREVAVVGVPDEHWGEAVVAVVATSAPVDEATVLAGARRELAAYKVPKRVVFAEELPKTMSGKIQRRRVLADMVEGSLA